MKEQLAVRAPLLTRRYKSSGGLAAGTLADLQQGSARKLSKHLCRRHRWRLAMWSRTCIRCGVVEDRER
jgi:hypothetical protein